MSDMKTSSSVPSWTMTLGAPSEAISAFGRVERDDLAVIDDRDAVAQHLGLVHVVRGEQDRAAAAAEALRGRPRAAGATADRGPCVGSSRNSRSGSPTSAQATDSRCFCPPDSLPTQLPSLALELDEPRAARRLDGRDRRTTGSSRSVSSTVSLSASCVSWSWMPSRCAQLALVALPSAARAPRRRPSRASSRPSRISMVVVLPAPFGPSSPKHSPRCTSSDSPSTATTSP